VSARKLLVLGLVAVVALAGLLVVGCGGDDDKDSTAAMQTALDQIEADIASLTATMTSGGTTADVKAAKDDLQPHWQAIVDACDGVEGADAAKAQQVWDDTAAAIDGVPEGADLMTLAGAVMGPVTALQAYVAELRELVGPSPSS
jgi:outer membrane murein-binding lipoprotein Lpp